MKGRGPRDDCVREQGFDHRYFPHATASLARISGASARYRRLAGGILPLDPCCNGFSGVNASRERQAALALAADGRCFQILVFAAISANGGLRSAPAYRPENRQEHVGVVSDRPPSAMSRPSLPTPNSLQSGRSTPPQFDAIPAPLGNAFPTPTGDLRQGDTPLMIHVRCGSARTRW